MSNYNDIRLLLNIEDKNIIFKDNCVKHEIINKINTTIIHASLVPAIPNFCPICGSIHQNSIIRYGFKLSTIKLLKTSNLNSLLKLNKQRFFCKSCNSTFISETPFVKRNCYISKPLIKACILQLKKKISLKDIAENYNVSVGTLNRLLHGLYDSTKIMKNYLPEHISMDEFKSVKSSVGAMSFVFLDATTEGKIVDIVEDRRLNSLIKYYMSYTLCARSNVKTVCIDMYAPYITLVNHCFPNAKIIIDRFHIIQLLSRSLNKTRIAVMNENKIYYNKLKRYWKLLLKNNNSLDFTNYRKYTCFKQLITESDIVDYLINADKILHDTYWLYQDLLEAFENKKHEQFIYILKNHQYNISKYLDTSVKTLIKYEAYIKNSLTYTQNNGKVEGTNNLIKVIKRIAFGYRNFTTFKTRILLISDTIVNTKKTRIEL